MQTKWVVFNANEPVIIFDTEEEADEYMEEQMHVLHSHLPLWCTDVEYVPSTAGIEINENIDND